MITSLRDLINCKHLKTLSIENTQIGVEQLIYLVETSIEKLFIQNTPIVNDPRKTDFFTFLKTLKFVDNTAILT